MKYYHFRLCNCAPRPGAVTSRIVPNGTDTENLKDSLSIRTLQSLPMVTLTIGVVQHVDCV